MQSKLDQFMVLMSMDESHMPEEYGEDIYHYTSPEGFMSILLGDADKATLWASRYDCLNDVSEGTVAEQVFQEVCRDLLDSGSISNELYELFSAVKPARTILFSHYKAGEMKITRSECDRYVCSFSKNRDSLTMWNYYSKGNKYEGFNIGFLPLTISNSLEDFMHDKESLFHIYPVIYDKENQKRLIKSTLIKLKENYSQDREPVIRYVISDRLLDWSLVFKNECFQHEEEVRIIVDIAKREKRIPVKYRVNAGHIVPYIALMFDKEDVSHVHFGPLQCGEEQKQHQQRVMEEMLEAKGYTALVDYSKVPVRY